MNFFRIILFLPFLTFPTFSVKLDIISIENPIEVKIHCESMEMKQGKFYDPLVDHLIEDGCKYPVRQEKLKKSFEELFPDKNIKQIVEKGLIDWEYLKETNLDIPSEFSEFDGYLFINDVNPICSAKESLLLRICFTKNPTRVFGRPQMLETSDGTLYQFAVNDRFMSSSDCLISGNYGRCMRKRSSIVFEVRDEFKTSSISSPIESQYSFSLNGMIGAISLIFSFILIGSFILFRNRKTSIIRETNFVNDISRIPSRNHNVTQHIEIPFIDDSIVFDI